MKQRITYRLLLLLLTLAMIPAVPLFIILSGVNSAEYVMRGTLNLSEASSKQNLQFGEVYIDLLGRMAVLDFGQSTATGQPARTIVASSLAESAKVILPAMLIAYVIGTLVGVGIQMSSLIGQLMRWLRFTFFIPIIVFAYLLAYLLSYAGVSSISPLRYLVAGAVLAIFPTYLVIQSVNRTIVDISSSKFFQYHLAMGFSTPDAWARFCWRLLAIDYLSFAVHMLVFMFGFLYFVEVPLGIEGMGPRFVSSIYRYDYPVIVGFCSIAVLLIGVIGFLVDMARSWLDPRKVYV